MEWFLGIFDREMIIFFLELATRGIIVFLGVVVWELVKKNNLQHWVKQAVWAAEKLFGEGTGEFKREWVIDFLSDKIKGVTEEELIVLIEAAVEELDRLRKQADL